MRINGMNAVWHSPGCFFMLAILRRNVNICKRKPKSNRKLNSPGFWVASFMVGFRITWTLQVGRFLSDFRDFFRHFMGFIKMAVRAHGYAMPPAISSQISMRGEVGNLASSCCRDIYGNFFFLRIADYRGFCGLEICDIK